MYRIVFFFKNICISLSVLLLFNFVNAQEGKKVHFQAKQGFVFAKNAIGDSISQMQLVLVELFGAEVYVDQNRRRHLLAKKWAYTFQHRSRYYKKMVIIDNENQPTVKYMDGKEPLEYINDSWNIDVYEIQSIIENIVPRKDFMLIHNDFLTLGFWELSTKNGIVRKFAWFVPLVNLYQNIDGSFNYGQVTTACFIDPIDGSFEILPSSSIIKHALLGSNQTKQKEIKLPPISDLSVAAFTKRNEWMKKNFQLYDNAEKKDNKLNETEIANVLPAFYEVLLGQNEVRVRNPNNYYVMVGIRQGTKGINFKVPSEGSSSVYIPDGKYDIYFVYSNEPNALFQGDGFFLNRNGVEIRLIKVVGGNYGIKRVK